MQRRGPDSLEGWFVSLVCCLISTLMYGSAGLSSMLFVASISRYDTDRNKAAFPFILCNVLQAATGPFAGHFARRYSERNVLVVGSVLAFVGIGTCFFAETITEVTVLWGVVFGIGFGLSTLLLPAIINNYFYKHRSKALGMCYLGSPIGFLIFPPIFEALLNKYGLSGTFLFLCGINMHCVPLSMCLRKPNFKEASANQPLNHPKEKITYLSTGTTEIRHKPSIQNGEIRTRTIMPYNSDPRRFSFEFLWYQAPSANEANEGNKQYICNLNKSCYGTDRERIERTRSYEKLNRSLYENLDKASNVSKTFTLPYPRERDNYCVDSHKSAKSGETDVGSKGHHCNFLYEVGKDRIENAIFPPVDIKKKSCKAIETENCTNTNMCNRTSMQNYNQFSTIYLGRCQQSCITVKPMDSSGHVCNSQANQDLYRENRQGNYHNSLSELGEINCIASTTSISPLVIDAKGNTPESLEANCFLEDTSSKGRGTSDNQNTSFLSLYCNPIFILMSIVNAIYNLQFSAITTVIVDFARDHNIDASNDKFIMMCLSLMGACGMLGFGWVTDSGYLSRNRFASLLLFIGSVSVAVLPMTVGFTMLMTALGFWCTSQSSFVLLIPAIIAEYFDEDTQAVAVSASNILCAPLYLIIPPLIGYFRDGQGSYDNIFYLLSALSLLNSAAVFMVPCIARWKNTADR